MKLSGAKNLPTWQALGRGNHKTSTEVTIETGRAGRMRTHAWWPSPRASPRTEKEESGSSRRSSLGAMALARPASFTKSSFHSLATGFRLLGYQKSLLYRNAGLSAVKQRQTTTMLARVSHVASLPFRRCERRSFVHSLRYSSPRILISTSQYDFRAFSVTETMWVSSFPELVVLVENWCRILWHKGLGFYLSEIGESVLEWVSHFLYEVFFINEWKKLAKWSFDGSRSNAAQFVPQSSFHLSIWYQDVLCSGMYVVFEFSRIGCCGRELMSHSLA